MLRRSRGRETSRGALLFVGGLALSAALVAGACSNSNGSTGPDAAADFDGACGPLPESLSVSSRVDCVANVPNPCCTGFYEFSCAPGDGGGAQCSETATCTRAARYDQSLCNGAQAYSCPDLSGTNYATMTTPGCEQMEGVGPAGEGIRWCCGTNLPPVTTIDAAAPPPVVGDASGDGPTGDASTD
jgi:hypothetical protein